MFIAGGVGVTPIRTLAEEAIYDKLDSILLLGNRSPDDAVLKTELENLSGLATTLIYSDAPANHRGETGRIDLPLIKRLVPDYKQRDIFLCGPPPMMDGIVESLQASGFPQSQLHFERFALHG